MAFQLPTTTAASAPSFSFGLNTAPGTVNTGAAVPAKPATFSFAAPSQAANAGGGDADATKSAAPPPFGGFGLSVTQSAPGLSNPLTGLGGGGLGAGAAPTAVGAAAPAAAAAAAFGGFMAQPAAAAASVTTTTAAATTANPLGGGGLSLGLTTTPKSTTAIAPVAAAPVASLAGAAPAAGAGTFANLSTATKTTDSSTVANATQLSYNQLEEHINKWTLEFEEQEKVFTEQATQINAWDKLLIGNNQKIIELNDAVQKVKNDQQVLDQELEFIATQHKELEESLAPLEKEFTSLPRVDQERSQTYLMVENLDTQLKQMSEDLKEVIDNLNEANKGQDNTDPIIQIGKILNAHMNSLQWIESQSTHICKKLDDIGKIHESQKRDIFRAPY
ncbi:nuclear pore glycoprotein p62 [Drosophila novamexicana]|uniref:nuclear pore glycoprotein p62 n=1 Tax=Drosophila novamexicana TaxID=47314 RepID=UPI0011E5AA0A|nr:nuclear pore glycoprotein p62 [Drosophila novamexicana]